MPKSSFFENSGTRITAPNPPPVRESLNAPATLGVSPAVKAAQVIGLPVKVVVFPFGAVITVPFGV